MKPEEIIIREVGLREGLQIHPEIVPTPEKLTLLSLLINSGVKEIEIGSLVRADKVPQMADTEKLFEEVLLKYPKLDSPKLIPLYLNQKGFQKACSIRNATVRAWIPTALSETFLLKNSNQSHEQFFVSIRDWEKSFQEQKLKLYGLMISTVFGCHYEGRFSSDKLQEFVKKVFDKLEYLPEEICLADTVGLGTPKSIEACIKVIKDIIPKVKISLHLHDTYGLGIANAYTGYKLGVRIFESSFGGVGGCPFTKGASGNITTEELVYLFESEGVKTGIKLEMIKEASKFARERLKLVLNSKIK